ncbi:putative G-protein coupled receptor No18-like protein [Dinothrombium tinctorium]|uniref:Putative G-protein coupled receptor No18-like protein n=1 Tax=Dinothrombium tinctorium TaxID=1965070 RepID=A0A3S3NYF7_9ACAR|nr:putative G-protein coupled receptor No18-like protein [Dinothrombium tinctorium]RWS02359.1 putative G-protein coupled receptor No18-like protein [Dinothrombium tinctorium]RWS04323.1 putative G-protein coupled receptor No18-like protein [Dinothrombium tinctorium]
MFILSLAVADLIVGITVMPISSAYVLTGDWIFGIVVCQIWLIIDYTASTASILNLLILSLDRYWSIKSPLKYLSKRTKKRALGMIVIVWILSASWIIPIMGWHRWYNGGIRKHPSNVCETEFSNNVLFKVTASSLNFFIPMSLMVVLYFKIYREIKRRGEIDIGRCSISLSYSANGNRSGNKLPPKKFKRELERNEPLRSSSSSWSGKLNIVKNNKDIAMISSKSSFLLGSRADKDEIGETCIDEDKPSKNCSSAEAGDDCDMDCSNVKHYQKLTIVKPENSSFSFEDYKDIQVKVKYINGGSQGMVSECLQNKQETLKQMSDKLQAKDSTDLKIRKKEKVKAGGKSIAKKWFVSSKTLKAKEDDCSSSDKRKQQKIIKVESSDLKVNSSLLRNEDLFGTCELSRQPTVSSLQSRQSHQQALRKVESSRLRQEKKAARQLGVILGAFTLCWLPYVIVFIITGYCACISHSVHTIVIWLGYVNSTINPFLYALCNDNFKNAFRKLLARSAQQTVQNNFETLTHGTSFRVSRNHENQFFS